MSKHGRGWETALDRIKQASFEAICALAVLVALTSCAAIFAPLATASQSSIQTRSAYNSEQQLTYTVGGVWGFSDRAFGSGGFTYSRSPIRGAGVYDTFYQMNLGAGYSFGTIAFDTGFIGSVSPLTEIVSKGGYIGLTYVHIPSNVDPEDQTEHSLSVLHQQVYPSSEQKPALFWVRTAFTGTTMSTDLHSPPNNKAKGTTFTFDGYYPANPELLLSAGIGFNGYDSKSQAFFEEAQRNMTTLSRFLLGATVLGLPRTMANVSATWQVSQNDWFMPRLSSTEVESTRLWTHTIDLGWRHQLMKNVFVTPTYESSIQGNRVFTGFLFDINYIL